MGSELATTADPLMLRVLQFRVETPNDLWIPPDDINSSWPRLHSPKVNGGEAFLDVIVIIWNGSDIFSKTVVPHLNAAFQVRCEEHNSFSYFGMEVYSVEDEIQVQQCMYIKTATYSCRPYRSTRVSP